MRMLFDVFDFALKAGVVKPGQDTPPETAELYKRLMHEEFKEFQDAITDKDKFDACLDLIWVTLGYCICRHWGVVGGWAEVARTNQEKFQLDPLTGNIRRRADGKILKPDNWQPPDLTPFLNGEGPQQNIEEK